MLLQKHNTEAKNLSTKATKTPTTSSQMLLNITNMTKGCSSIIATVNAANANVTSNYCNCNSNIRRKTLRASSSSSSSNSNSWTQIMAVTFLVFLLSCCDLAHAALRNVNLYIEPPAVRRGQTVTLRCHYDLEGAPLYSVKFYRGQLEFFRYTPGELQSTKVFYYPGIKVDEHASNATQVVIRNVGFSLTGNFSCEVTADAPLFSTATAYATVQVVEFPEKRPQLFTEQSRYEPGMVLRANCSTPPSRPRAELRFTLNSVVVSSGETQYIRTVDNLIASRISLKLQLQSIHFSSANPHMTNGILSTGNDNYGRQPLGGTTAVGGGSLILRCTAQIVDLYQEYKEIELGSPQHRDPVPARVTLSSGSGLKGFFDSYFSTSAAASISTTKVTVATMLHTQLLTISIAAGVIGAFHWLQLYRCR